MSFFLATAIVSLTWTGAIIHIYEASPVIILSSKVAFLATLIWIEEIKELLYKEM